MLHAYTIRFDVTGILKTFWFWELNKASAARQLTTMTPGPCPARPQFNLRH